MKNEEESEINCEAAVEESAVIQELSKNSVSPEEKMGHFKYIMDGIVSEALRVNNALLEEELVELVADRLMLEMGVMEQQREEREEARFRKLDETIRGRQRGFQEVAAAKLPPYTPTKMHRRRFGLFRK